MSRRRKTKVKKERQLEPEEVLDGSVEVRVEALFDLIHRVNPTRQRLSKKGQARRYALKNRLQSLLIRRFGDDHLKVETTEQTGVVSLEHISGLRDACHTIYAELEPDARSWVRHQLDLAAAGSEEPEFSTRGFEAPEVETGVPGKVADLLERGRRALEAYDYEGGEELLRRAFEQSLSASGEVRDVSSAAAATALLELQVDVLGMDAAALELESRLSTAAKERPEVRTLLALAAARLGEVEHALEWVKGLTGAVAGVSLPRAAEVYAALASRAIHDGDRRAARGYLRRVAELDPTHVGIPALEAEINRLRAERLSVVEAELEQRFRELGAAAVEDQARALADRWPEGEVARRILRQAAAEHRQAEIAEHLERGELARAEGRAGDAAGYFQAALDAGSERPDLSALVAELADLDRRARERSAIDDVCRRLAAVEMSDASERDVSECDTDQRDALLAYLALADDLRGGVQGTIDRPALGWLDELEAPRAGAKAQVAVSAVLALEHAGSALEEGEAEKAAGLIEPYQAVLRRVEQARGLGREASRQIALGQRQRALETLTAAENAFGEKLSDDARRLLAVVSLGDLDDGGLARAQDLQARIDGIGALERLEREHDELLAAGDLIGALARARKLEEETRVGALGSHGRWLRAFGEIQDRVDSAWRLEVIEDGTSPIDEALQPSHWLESSVTWLDDEGRELILANSWGHWLFIDAVDLDSGTLTTRLSMRTPGVLERPLLTVREGDRLWVAGRNGNVLEIAREGWRVLGFYPAHELLSGDRTIERARPMPGGAWLWLQVSEPWGAQEICLADLRQWRLARKLPPGATDWVPIVGDDDPRMLVRGSGFAARLYTADGELVSSEPLAQTSVLDADRGPGGEGLLLLLSEPRLAGGAQTQSDEDAKPGIGLTERSRSLVRFVGEPEGGALRPAARYELPQAHRYHGFYAVVTSLDRGLSFVLISTQDGDNDLLVFSGEAPPDRLEPITQTRWSSKATLVHDRQGRHIAAMIFDDGFQLRFLDQNTSPLVDARREREKLFPSYKVFGTSCGRPGGSLGAEVSELAAELEERGVGPLRTHFARIESSESTEVDDKLRVALALRQGKREREMRDAIAGFARRTAQKYPSHAGAVLLLADIEAEAERWEEVSRLLRRADPSSLDAGRARHFRHLQGLAHLHGGRLEKAYEAFRLGTDHEGHCGVEPLMHLTQPMMDPPGADEWTPEQPTIRRLVGAIRTADRALAAGDPAVACAALDRRDVRWLGELQIAARRASAYLEAARLKPLALTRVERFAERSALAFYSQVRQLERYMRHNLYLPDLRWDESRLAEIEERAIARLEETDEE